MAFVKLEFSPVKRPPTQTSAAAKRAKYYAEFSPTKEPEEEVPILVLKRFAAFPYVSFNKAIVGKSKTCLLKLENPTSEDQKVLIEKFPSNKGFFVESLKFLVEANGSYDLLISWIPEEPGKFRETIVFVTSSGCRTQAYLLGSATSPAKRKKLPPKKRTSPEGVPKPSKVLGSIRNRIEKENSSEFAAIVPSSAPAFVVQNDAEFSKPLNYVFLQNHNELDGLESPLRRQTYLVSNATEDSVSARPALDEISPKKDNLLSQPVAPQLCKTLFPDLSSRRETYIKPNVASDVFYDSLEMSHISELLEDSIAEEEQRHDRHHAVSGNIGASYPCSDEKGQVKSVRDTFDVPCPSINIFASDRLGQHSNLKPSIFEGGPHSLKLVREPRVDMNHSMLSVNLAELESPFCSTANITNLPELNCTGQSHISTSVNLGGFGCHPKEQIECSKLKNSTFRKPFDKPALSNKAKSAPKFPSKSTNNLERKSLNKVSSGVDANCSTVGGSKSNSEQLNKADSSSRNIHQSKKKSVVATKLTLIKPEESAAVRNPNPLASNLYYDEKWMKKQEAAFTRWLNFILSPPDEINVSSDLTPDEAAKLWLKSLKDAPLTKAPTKEDMSLKAYSATQRLNKLRRASQKLFHSPKMITVIRKLESEVDQGRLLIRKDRAINADYGIKREIIRLLMSYNPLWLRIGLETIYGCIINMDSNLDLCSLSKFIVNRFLNNPTLASEYARPHVTNLFKPGYEVALKKFTLKKFLLLVYFLDFAKCSRLIDHDPCLFCKKSEFKSSRDMLLAFSRDYLSGEGDVTRHLKQLGYVVVHKQTALDEFDYQVTNVAVDLRCGLRLARVMELVLRNYSLSSSLRVPAISRLQKIHNNDVAIDAFVDSGYTLHGDVTSRDLVNGHREKTLDFLWQIIFETQLLKLLDVAKLRKELVYLRTHLKLKADVAAFEAIKMQSETTSSEYKTSFVESKIYKDNECIQLLLHWCQAVCEHYGLKVWNFTTSFSDGRALCYLLNHYHPMVLPLEKIHSDTTFTYFKNQDLNDSDTIHFYDKASVDEMQVLLKNEQENLRLAFDKFLEIGGIPVLPSPSDMSNTIPDEKVVITLVCYVNVRLLSLSDEIKAARVLQLAWRRKKLNQRREAYKHEIKAIVTLQRAIKKFLHHCRQAKLCKAATVIQCSWRRNMAVRKLEFLRSEKQRKHLETHAIIIQAAYRGCRARTQLKREQAASVLIQAHVRGWIARSQHRKLRQFVIKIQQKYKAKILGAKQRQNYLSQLGAASLIQAHYRSYRQALLQQKEYQAMRRGFIHLQAAYRGKKVRKEMEEFHKSATVIQSCFRQYVAQRQYLKLRQAAVTMQERYRANCLMKQKVCEFQRIKHAALVIQSMFRGYVSRKETARLKCAIVITSFIKMCAARNKYLHLKSASVKLQALARMKIAQRHYKLKREAVICIQKHYRGHRLTVDAREHFLQQKQASIVIQSFYRGFVARRCAKEIRAAVTIQSFIRMLVARKSYVHLKCSVIKIQSLFRMTLARNHFIAYRQIVLSVQRCYRRKLVATAQRQKFLKLKNACVIIQSWYRAVVARRTYLEFKHSCIKIQSLVRMKQDQRKYIQQCQAAKMIQVWWRRKCLAMAIRSCFLKQKQACIVIQSFYRGLVARRAYTMLRQSCIKIQALVRMKLARTKYLQQCSAAKQIQQWWKGKILAMATRSSFLKQKQACIVTQSFYRGLVARRTYMMLRQSCIKIQALVRMKLARTKYLRQCSAAKQIQQWWRGKILAKINRSSFLKQKQACIVIQSFYRGFMARKLRRELCATIVIQSYFKMYLDRKSYLHLKCSVIKIQSFFRMSVARSHFVAYRQTVLFVQRHYRQKLVAGAQRQTFIELRSACVTVQSIYKATVTRRAYMTLRRSCIKMQALVRMKQTQRKYLVQCQAAKNIQLWWRGKCLTTKLNQDFIEARTACIRIQSWYRATKQRNLFLNICQHVILIQATFRRFSARQRYLKAKSAAITIQNFWRDNQKARKEEARNSAALTIQKNYRMYKAKCMLKILKEQRLKKLKQIADVVHLNLQAIVIQRCYRQYQFRKTSAIWLQAVMCLQHWFRSKLVRLHFLKLKSGICAFQISAKLYLQELEVRRKHQAARKIQALWRGYKARCCSEKQVLDARRKIEAATQEASKEMTLNCRTIAALDFLLHGGTYSGIIKSLNDLEAATRLSSVCCEKVAAVKGPDILINFVKTLNRSLPHMEMIEHIADILLNLCKHEKTIDSVYYAPHCLVTILDISKNFRETAQKIFTKCVSLLWMFTQDPMKAKEMKTDSTLIETVRSLHFLVSRKKQIDEKRLQTKQKMASSWNSSSVLFNYSTLSTTVSTIVPRESLNIQPDWILSKKAMREYTDPYVAITALMKSLQLKKK